MSHSPSQVHLHIIVSCSEFGETHVSIRCKKYFSLCWSKRGSLYGATFIHILSPIAHLNSIRILLSLAVNLESLMFQLDVKNIFLYDDIKQEFYMEQPLGMLYKWRIWFANLRKPIMNLNKILLLGLRSSL